MHQHLCTRKHAICTFLPAMTSMAIQADRVSARAVHTHDSILYEEYVRDRITRPQIKSIAVRVRVRGSKTPQCLCFWSASAIQAELLCVESRIGHRTVAAKTRRPGRFGKMAVSRVSTTASRPRQDRFEAASKLC